MKFNKQTLGLMVVGGVWCALTAACILKPQTEASLSERRKLASFPETNAQTLLSGKFMTDFETYSLDQFPLRDSFRTLKAVTSFYALGKKDNNGIYLADGYAAKLEYPLDENSVTAAAKKFAALYDTYSKDNGGKVYLAVAPDKGYFLAEKNGYPALDYEKMLSLLQENMPFAEYIDLFSHLSLEDYYKTDTHWRQEKIIDASRVLASAMGGKGIGDYTQKKADVPFYGVYYGQAALPLPSETLYYVTNDVLDGCTVTNLETGKSYTGTVDFEKETGKDPYEMFLSGASPLIVIENPNAETEKELVVFRDSFGSSMAPLLVSDYRKVTLVDTRYIAPRLIGNFVSFDGADVLFLYSTLVLNQSGTLKD